MILLLLLVLAAGGLLALAATDGLSNTASAVAATAGDPGAGAALAEARQRWLSMMVGLLAAVVLLAFLLVVRLARRPAVSPLTGTVPDTEPRAGTP